MDGVIKLRVFIVCSRCHRQTEVLVENGWDIRAVTHDCKALQAFDVQRGKAKAVRSARQAALGDL